MRDKLIEYLAVLVTLLIYAVIIYFIVNILIKQISYIEAFKLAGCVRVIRWMWFEK